MCSAQRTFLHASTEKRREEAKIMNKINAYNMEYKMCTNYMKFIIKFSN